MRLMVFSLSVGVVLAALGLAQTLEFATLIDSGIVRATLPVGGREALFVGATVFLVGTLLFAGGLATRSGR